MAKQNPTFEDMAKQGFAMVGGVLKHVKADSPHTVKKIDMSLFDKVKIYQDQIDASQRRMRAMIADELDRETTGHFITLPNKMCEQIVIKYSFDLPPFPAPRMVRGDQWKTDPNHTDPAKRQRKPVTRYFAWRDAFRLMCKQNGYTLQETLRVLFIMPMPKYLSRKKREMRMGQAHKQRPDTDNMLKSIKDSFNVDDGFVWDERGVKIWGEVGRIVIF